MSKLTNLSKLNLNSFAALSTGTGITSKKPKIKASNTYIRCRNHVYCSPVLFFSCRRTAAATLTALTSDRSLSLLRRSGPSAAAPLTLPLHHDITQLHLDSHIILHLTHSYTRALVVNGVSRFTIIGAATKHKHTDTHKHQRPNKTKQ